MPLSEKHYEWRRYWVRREGSMSFDDQGFIAEPGTDQFGIILPPNHVPFEKIAHLPCLALLGEPVLVRLTLFNVSQAQAEVRLRSGRISPHTPLIRNAWTK